MFNLERNNRQEPIRNSANDKLNRGNFVNYIVNIIRNAPIDEQSFTVAINGKWGEGKTSIRNLIIEKFLQKKSNSILLEFNSLDFQNQKELYKIFLDKVLKAIKYNKKNSVVDFIKENKKLFWYIFLLCIIILNFIFPNLIVKIFTILFYTLILFKNQIQQVSLSSLTDVVSKSFMKADVIEKILYYDEIKADTQGNSRLVRYIKTKCEYDKIIIFVDNFDSLEPNQIKLLIQLIQNNLNLPKFVFVLFYDRFIVENCLTTNVYSGSDFLDKFANIQLDLPLITDDILLTFLQGELEEQYNLHVEYTEQFDYIKSYFSSLNKIYSFLDTFKLNYVLLSKNLKMSSVNFNKNDFLFLEVLRFFENDVYREIRKSKFNLTKFKYEKTPEEKKMILNKILSYVKNPNNVKNVEKIILSLFPYLSDTGDFEAIERKLYDNKAVGNFEYFDHYFMYDLTDNVLSFEYFNILRQKMLNNKEFVKLFKELFCISNDNAIHLIANNFLYKLNKKISDSGVYNFDLLQFGEQREFIKNIIWLYIYSDRDISNRRYINNILVCCIKTKEDFENLINILKAIIDEKDYFYQFYTMEFLLNIRNVFSEILFINDSLSIEYYKSKIKEILLTELNSIMKDDNYLKYLVRDNFNSKLQVYHIIVFLKERQYLKQEDKTKISDGLQRFFLSEEFLLFKKKIFSEYFSLIYFFTDVCTERKIISNKLKLKLNDSLLYPFTMDEIIQAFKINKVNKRDKIYATLISNKKNN